MDDADVISVPGAAGREALARLVGYAQPAVAPGPVALSATGRVLFYVAPGGRDDLPELLDWLDWGGVELDLEAHSAGELPDPPVEWLHPAPAGGAGPAGGPAGVTVPPGNAVEPPQLIALLATIATACHRLAVTRGARASRDVPSAQPTR